MSDRKYRQPEQRRAEETRRYGKRSQQTGGQSGQQSSQHSGREFQQTGGSMDRTGRRMEETGGQMEQTGGRTDRTGGEMGRSGGEMERTGGGMGRQSGGSSSPMGHQSPQMSQKSPQTGQQSTQTGQQSTQMGHQSSQMGRGDMQIGQGGMQMGGQRSGMQQRQAPIQPVTVSDLVATDIVTAHPDDSVTDVVRKMATEDVGSVVIVQHDRPVGIVTDRKITLALGDTPDVSRMQVSDLMTEDVFTVSENTNVFDLIRELSDRAVRRAPVIDDRGKLRGIVSLDDVIVLLAEEFYNVGQIIRKQSPRL